MGNEITIKEVYERLIKLETIVESKYAFDRRNTKSFSWLFWFIIILDLISIVIHLTLR